MERKRISQRVIGAAYEVSNTLGSGFLESVYEEAMCAELVESGLRFERQKPLKVSYKRYVVGEFIADLVVEGCLIVELKAVSKLTPVHESQVMNYLKATGLSVALLLNFGTPNVGIRRVVWEYDDATNI